MTVLDDVLLSPWLVPSVIAIFTTFFSAYLTLRANIREKAWLVVYKEKRREIRKLIRKMDDFASTLVKGCEVIALDEKPVPDQIGSIALMVRQRFGIEAEQSDPIAKTILDLLPTPKMLYEKSPEIATRIDLAKRGLRNTYEMDLQGLNFRVSDLKSTLALSVRNPDLIREATDLLNWAYDQVHSKPLSFSGVDADPFAEDWSKRISPIKLGLREDLTKSSWSLGSATRLSWRWRFRRWRRHRQEAKSLTKEST